MSTPTPSSRPRIRRLGATLVAALALLGPVAAASSAHAATPTADLTVEVSPATVAVGDTVVITVRASNVSDLYAYDLVLSSADALLEPTGVEPIGPDGGFTSAVASAGAVTVSHTRLGTSPGLSSTEAIALATLEMRTVGTGSTRIDLSAVRLVSSTGEATTLGAGASASLSVSNTPVPTPGPTSSPTSTPTSTPTPTSSPVPTLTPSASPSPTGTAAAATGSSGTLAVTGVDAAAWLVPAVAGVALVAAGALFVIRRRQGVRE